MDYGKILQRAGEIIWKHKVLWLFGILAGCGQSVSGGMNFRIPTGRGRQPPFVHFMTRWFEQMGPAQVALVVAAILGLMVVVGLLLTALRAVGLAGLIKGAAMADEEVSFSLGELFQASRERILPLFGLELLFGIAVFAFFVVLVGGVAVIGLATLGLGILCLLPLLCLIVPLLWAVNVIVTQAEIALVLEGSGVVHALQRGWQVVREHLGEYIVMGLILLIGGGVAGFLLSLPMFMVVFPAMISTMNHDTTGWWIAGGCLVLYLPVLVVLSGLLQSYIQTAWTLTYRELTRPGDVEGEVKDYVEPLAA